MKKQLTFEKMVFRKKLYKNLYHVAEFLTLLWIFFVFIVFMVAGNV
jgi:hypothetical protein